MPGLVAVRLVAATAACLLLGAACDSPTLPLPPPMEPTITMGSDANHVKLNAICGGAEPDAIIVVENTDTSLPDDERIGGTIADGCGAWDANVYARPSDVLNVTQESGTDTSPPVTVQVPTTL